MPIPDLERKSVVNMFERVVAMDTVSPANLNRLLLHQHLEAKADADRETQACPSSAASGPPPMPDHDDDGSETDQSETVFEQREPSHGAPSMHQAPSCWSEGPRPPPGPGGGGANLGHSLGPWGNDPLANERRADGDRLPFPSADEPWDGPPFGLLPGPPSHMTRGPPSDMTRGPPRRRYPGSQRQDPPTQEPSRVWDPRTEVEGQLERRPFAATAVEDPASQWQHAPRRQAARPPLDEDDEGQLSWQPPVPGAAARAQAFQRTRTPEGVRSRFAEPPPGASPARPDHSSVFARLQEQSQRPPLLRPDLVARGSGGLLAAAAPEPDVAHAPRRRAPSYSYQDMLQRQAAAGAGSSGHRAGPSPADDPMYREKLEITMRLNELRMMGIDIPAIPMDLSLDVFRSQLSEYMLMMNTSNTLARAHDLLTKGTEGVESMLGNLLPMRGYSQRVTRDLQLPRVKYAMYQLIMRYGGNKLNNPVMVLAIILLLPIVESVVARLVSWRFSGVSPQIAKVGISAVTQPHLHTWGRNANRRTRSTFATGAASVPAATTPRPRPAAGPPPPRAQDPASGSAPPAPATASGPAPSRRPRPILRSPEQVAQG